MRAAKLDEVEAGAIVGDQIINNLRHADDTTLLTKSEANMKDVLVRTRQESFDTDDKKIKVLFTGLNNNIV